MKSIQYPEASEPSLQTVTVAFPYALTGIPRRCRRAREMLVWGSTTAVVRTVEPGEMQVAFHVEFPSADRLRYVSRPTPAIYRTHDLMEYLNIYRHERKLWWPLKIDRDRTRCGKGILLDFLEQLESRSHDLLNMLPRGVSPAAVTARPRMRSVDTDGLGLAEAFVQRTICENLLISGDKVFVRGGAPVFVKNSFGRKRFWEIQAVDPGPDRAARTVQVGLRTEFDVFADWWVQAAFREGLMWQAVKSHRTPTPFRVQ